jgi:CheY-like chemotaxis protein
MTIIPTPRTPLMLFAEDDHEDWILIRDTLQDCTDQVVFERVEDGVQLLARLRDEKLPLPNLIMLDLQMPKMDGGEALRQIRGDKRLRHIPVVIMTTSKLEVDVFKAYYDGANSYLIKPVTFEAMGDALVKLHDYWVHLVQLPQAQRETGS